MNHSDSKFIVKTLIPFLIQGLRTQEKLWMTQKKTHNLTIRRQMPPLVEKHMITCFLVVNGSNLSRGLCQSDQDTFHPE